MKEIIPIGEIIPIRKKIYKFFGNLLIKSAGNKPQIPRTTANEIRERMKTLPRVQQQIIPETPKQKPHILYNGPKKPSKISPEDDKKIKKIREKLVQPGEKRVGSKIEKKRKNKNKLGLTQQEEKNLIELSRQVLANKKALEKERQKVTRTINTMEKKTARNLTGMLRKVVEKKTTQKSVSDRRYKEFNRRAEQEKRKRLQKIGGKKPLGKIVKAEQRAKIDAEIRRSFSGIKKRTTEMEIPNAVFRIRGEGKKYQRKITKREIKRTEKTAYKEKKEREKYPAFNKRAKEAAKDRKRKEDINRVRKNEKASNRIKKLQKSTQKKFDKEEEKIRKRHFRQFEKARAKIREQEFIIKRNKQNRETIANTQKEQAKYKLYLKEKTTQKNANSFRKKFNKMMTATPIRTGIMTPEKGPRYFYSAEKIRFMLKASGERKNLKKRILKILKANEEANIKFFGEYTGKNTNIIIEGKRKRIPTNSYPNQEELIELIKKVRPKNA